jgi:hypothetical protein
MTELSPVVEELSALRREARTSFDAADRRLEGLQTEVRDLKARFDAQPDFRLLMHTVRELVERVIELGEDVRMVRSAINDQARESVTPGEVDAIHHDFRTLTRADLDHAARIRRLEDTLSLPQSPI